MGSIRQLDTNLSNMIAAGEVVENPASVVKELLENAIDANSTRITIELQDSGLKSIKVIDDGIGMDSEDMEMALRRHATSKIKTEHDLHHIASLGFRGEALPSIASVSHMIIESSQSAEPGHLIRIKNGNVTSRETGAARQGTKVTVSDLFYNTPARLKHLRSKHRELSNIQSYVQAIALSHSHIAINLTNDDKTVLQTSGDGHTLKILNQIYPSDIIRNMLAFEGSDQYFTVRGYATKPIHTRSSRAHMMVMTNRRMIRGNRLLKAVSEAYDTYLPKHKHPIVYLEIEVDPVLIDVNVHPQKLSIKFTEEAQLERLIKKTIHDTLKETSIIPDVRQAPNHSNERQMAFDDDYQQPDKEGTSQTPPPQSSQDDADQAGNVPDTTYETQPGYPEKEAHRKVEETPIEDKHGRPSGERVPDLEYIGQLHGTYLLFQNKSGLYVMDQHAAAERVRYEHYYGAMKTPSPDTQRLTVPFDIRLSSEEVTLFDDYQETLEAFGIKAEKKDSTTLQVTTIPSWFRKNMEETYTEMMIRSLISDDAPGDIGKIIDPLAKNLSCKHSIRANKHLSREEVNKLLQDLRSTENPFTCPHGRPTIIRFSVHELETFFKRVQS